jgi:hypothetical protein
VPCRNIDIPAGLRVNGGVHRADGNVAVRDSEASADNRCLIIDTGLVQSPVDRIATARHAKCEDGALSSVQPLLQHGASTRQAGFQYLAYVIVEYAVAWRCGCVAVNSKK